MMMACSTNLADPEFGTYQVTSGTEQETGSPMTLSSPMTFTVAPTSDGLSVMSVDGSFPFNAPDVPGAKGMYHFEQFQGVALQCEAGPNKYCSFKYEGVTVTAPATGAIQIEHCTKSARTINDCGSPTPACGTEQAKQALAGMVPCTVPATFDGQIQ
jgi:hypothetical protein